MKTCPTLDENVPDISPPFLLRLASSLLLSSPRVSSRLLASPLSSRISSGLLTTWCTPCLPLLLPPFLWPDSRFVEHTDYSPAKLSVIWQIM